MPLGEKKRVNATLKGGLKCSIVRATAMSNG